MSGVAASASGSTPRSSSGGSERGVRGCSSQFPPNFQDNGTIAQLTESFVFWRVAKGGPGLPREGAPWNSAMPRWEDFLTEREIWSVILFLYDQTGWKPRTWEKSDGGAK